MNYARIIALFFLAALALPAYAASLSIETPLAAAGTPFLLPVTFSPDGESVNAVEGSVSVPTGVTIDSIDTSGSAFTIFASGPSYQPSSRSIEFTAGAPGGIQKGSVALLFVIHAHAESEGTYDFTPSGIRAYLNDGSGTALAVASQKAELKAGAPGSVHVDGFPAAPATPLIAEVGKDDSLFDGRMFATFYGGASGSSVDHYEVREGWWRAPVRADRYYVLLDQQHGSTIWVTAVSEDGKKVTTQIAPENPWMERILTAVLILAVGTVLFLVWRRFFRRRHS